MTKQMDEVFMTIKPFIDGIIVGYLSVIFFILVVGLSISIYPLTLIVTIPLGLWLMNWNIKRMRKRMVD